MTKKAPTLYIMSAYNRHILYLAFQCNKIWKGSPSLYGSFLELESIRAVVRPNIYSWNEMN